MTIESVLLNAAQNGNLTLVQKIISSLTDQEETTVSSFGWSQIIDAVYFSGLFDPSLTAQSEALIEEMMVNLSDNQFLDIAQLVDIGSLSQTMQSAAQDGSLNVVDSIISNLSDDAESFVGSFTWAQTIDAVYFSGLFDPSLTAQSEALIEEMMVNLSDNQFLDIAQLVDIGSLSQTMQSAAQDGSLNVVDSIISNLSDDAEVFVGSFTWAQTIDAVYFSGLFDPSLTAQSEALIEEMMVNLSDNQFLDIAQLVDIGSLSQTMQSAAQDGSLNVVDSIISNLSDDAESFVGSFTWAQTIDAVYFSGLFDPSLTAQSEALIEEMMVNLSDNQFLDIAQLVDIGSLSQTMQSAAQDGSLNVVDSIISNLSDDAEVFVGSFTWAQTIDAVYFSGLFDPSLTAQSEALIEEMMVNLSDNQFLDIAQLVDIGSLSQTMQSAAQDGSLNVVDSIISNLSDDAESFVGSFTWAQTIDAVYFSGLFDPSLTAQSEALIEEIMVNLSSNQFLDIAQLVDIGSLSQTMQSAANDGSLNVVDSIISNLSDDAEFSIAPFTWAQIIESVYYAGEFDPSLTAQSEALIEEMMVNLSSNQYGDIYQLVDIGYLGNVALQASYNGDLNVVDSIISNLSDDAELFIAPFTWAQIIESVYYAGEFDPSLTAQSEALIEEMMVNLSSNQYGDIYQLVDIGYLGNVALQASYNGDLNVVDSIISNLSDDAELFIAPFTWAQIIESVYYAGEFDPSLTAQSEALIEEMMVNLSSNQYGDIYQLVDIGYLGNVALQASYNGDLNVVDSIISNLSDDAEFSIAPFTWAQIIESVYYAGEFDPSLTAQSEALIEEMMVNLSSNQYGDIYQLVDIGYLGNVALQASYNGDLNVVDSIISNLSDDAEFSIAPFTWAQIIESVYYAGEFDPSLTAQSEALIEEMMVNLSSNQYGDIYQLVDIGYLGNVALQASYNGDLNVVDSIISNLSDDAEFSIAPFTWAQIIESVYYAGEFDPSLTAQSEALIEEMMVNLSSNQYGDIYQLVDIGYLNSVMQGMTSNGDYDALGSILNNLSVDGLTSIDTSAIEASGPVDLGTSGNDTLWDSAGVNEALYGLTGNDYVIGGAGDTHLYGGAGNDFVYDFSSGNDVISGGDGSDYLYGGAGSDTFVFHEGETGVDTLYVFSTNDGDKLDISDYLDLYDPLQNAIEDFVILTEVGNNTLVSVDVDGTGSGGSQDLVVLTNTSGLTIEDIIDTGTV